MVMHYEIPRSRGEVFIVRPNNSLKWRHAKLLFNVTALVMLGIGGVFWSIGAWLVAPFVLAELIVLAWGFHRVSLKCYSRQVIAVEPTLIRVIQGGDRGVFQVTPKQARVSLEQGVSRLSDAHLYLQSNESEVEIGDCLVESERKALAHDLSRAVAACTN